MDVANKIIIATGGYGHLGRAIVQALAAHGATVFVLGRSHKKFLEAFQENTSSIQFIEGDVASFESISKAVLHVEKQSGRIDVIINNAVYLLGKSPEHMTDDEWSAGVDGVLGSVFRCIRAVIPIMKKQHYGKIINVSSMYGMVAPDFSVYDNSPDFLNPPHYGAAKAGVIQLTRYYASYLGKYGINVNCVSPGPFPSAVVQQNEDFIRKLSQKTVLGRIGKPEDLAGVFVLLASDMANYITGQNIVVDGGWTVR